MRRVVYGKATFVHPDKIAPLAPTMENRMNRRVLIAGGGAVVAAAGAVAVSFARMGSLESYERAMAQRRAALPAGQDLKQIVRYATLAANGHNTQPWLFRIADREIRIEPDFGRRTPVVDPDDHHLFVSLGCAAENLSLAAKAVGLNSEMRFEQEDGGAVAMTLSETKPATSDLCTAIPHRQSTRADFDGRPVSASHLNKLQQAAQTPGVQAVITTERAQRDRVRDLVIAGNTAQIGDPAFVAELKHWMRFNPSAAIATGDGLFSATSGNPSLPDWIAKPLFGFVFTADAENRKNMPASLRPRRASSCLPRRRRIPSTG